MAVKMKKASWQYIVALVPILLLTCRHPVDLIDSESKEQTQSGESETTIPDEVHDDGNINFFFLPPLVPMPEYSGDFDGSLSPIVQIS